MAFSLDGTLLASAGEDREVWVSDLGTTRRLHAFTQPTIVNNVSFSPDGKAFAAGDEDGKLLPRDVSGLSGGPAR